ncbi:POK18 protein, partial [Steatornis caripensis]|nr:POK18 protein [Steatornis caripensis]
DQWPLKQDRLQIIHGLVQEQLAAGHIVSSSSPWNTPIFIIPKKSGKWRLLHYLRAVNAVIQDMGVLQPGLPTPVMIPKDWHLLIIDLKDCSFTIPLHPVDAEKFAFTVSAINKQEPAKRFHWVVVPQGMKNSPMICQTFVTWALQPFWNRHPELLVYHYMDDILVAGKELEHQSVFVELGPKITIKGRRQTGLKIAPEKVQRQAPWRYLGWVITGSAVRPQKILLTTKIRTLSDVQKLMGDIQWVRSVVGVTNDDLSPLMSLLGSSVSA